MTYKNSYVQVSVIARDLKYYVGANLERTLDAIDAAWNRTTANTTPPPGKRGKP